MKKKKPRKVVKTSKADRPAKRLVKHLIIILAAGILVRLIYNASLTGSIFLGNYILDSLVLHSWATDIVAGKTANTAFFRAPLYPYVLAMIYKNVWHVVLVSDHIQ